jgi:hypothetical protein
LKADASKEVVASPSRALDEVCTSVCTSNAETANAEHLEAFVASLTPEERRHLAALLAGEGQGDAS